MTAPQLVVGGTLTLDTLERGTAVHRGVPGGSALYAAAAASLTTVTYLLGVVGTDFPWSTLDPLWARGVRRDGVDVIEGPTFRWHARYTVDGTSRATLLREPGVAADHLPSMRAVPAAAYGLMLGSMRPKVQRAVLEAYPSAVLTGLDSMEHWWTTEHSALLQLLDRVDVVFVDETEARLAAHRDDVLDAATWLLDAGPEIVVLKRGAQGASLLRRGQAPCHITAVPVHAVDTTGAGDAFAGAFMAARLGNPALGDEEVLACAARAGAAAARDVGIGGLLGDWRNA